MMVSFVFCLWTLLTSAIAAVWTLSLLQPVWVLHPDNVHSFGLQTYCVLDTRESRDQQAGAMHKVCLPYGKELRIGNIPSGTWRAALLLFSSGTFLFIASVLLGLMSVFIQGKWDKYVSMTTKYLQITAGNFYLSGNLISIPNFISVVLKILYALLPSSINETFVDFYLT